MRLDWALRGRRPPLATQASRGAQATSASPNEAQTAPTGGPEPPAAPRQRRGCCGLGRRRPAPPRRAADPLALLLRGIAPPPPDPAEPETVRGAFEYAAICSLWRSGAAIGLDFLRDVSRAGADSLLGLRAWKACLARLAGAADGGCLEAVLQARPQCHFARLNGVLAWLQRPTEADREARRRDLTGCLEGRSPTQFARLVDAAWQAAGGDRGGAIARLRSLVDDWPFNGLAYAYLAELLGPDDADAEAALVAALWINPSCPLAHRLRLTVCPVAVSPRLLTCADLALRATPAAAATFLNMPLWRYDDMHALGMPTQAEPLVLCLDRGAWPSLAVASPNVPVGVRANRANDNVLDHRLVPWLTDPDEALRAPCLFDPARPPPGRGLYYLTDGTGYCEYEPGPPPDVD